MENYPSYIIKQTIANIKAKGIVVPDLDTLDLEDEKTYNFLASGDTHGIFQFQRCMDKHYLKFAKPEKFPDLIALIALNRLGPINNDMMWDFIDNKNETNHFDLADRKNPRKITDYIVPALEPILKESYGLIIYREQAVEIAVKIAGFTKEQGEIFRINLLKRDFKAMKTDKIKFIKGAELNNIPRQKAGKIYGLIKKYIGYTISRVYIEKEALLAYKMAYLKAHYPNEFMTSVKFKNMYE